MGFITVQDENRILTLINHLISKRVEITIKTQEKKKQFTTRLINIKTTDGPYRLIIEKLFPEAGNSVIESFPDIAFSFEVAESKCLFLAKYIGINSQPPDFGLIVSFPSHVQIEEKRKEQRVEDGLTKFISAEFVLAGDDKVYQLDVINLGAHGIGLIVKKENFDLLKKIKVGETIKDLRFFLPRASMLVDGKVKHKTQINQGRLKGTCIVGIESEFIMNLKELEDKVKKNK